MDHDPNYERLAPESWWKKAEYPTKTHEKGYPENGAE
jgi:hypothetical protein